MTIAWIGAILSTLGFLLCSYKNLTYPGSDEELFDRIQGFKKEWPGTKYFIVAIICWAFIFSFR